MTGFWGEVRYAARMLLKHPGVSGLAVVALGLGIGLTAVMFSIVYGALLRGLPFENGDRILMITRVDPENEQGFMSVPPHDYVDWAEQQTSFEELAGYYEGTVNVRWADEPERFDGAFMSANTFRALGVQAQLGRTFREEEDEYGAPATVILSHRLWMDRFSGDPGALGRVITVNGEAAEIIGVMPEDFGFPQNQEIWVPNRVDLAGTPRGQGIWLNVFGPLREGVSRDAAMVELAGIMQRLAAAYPETNEAEVQPAMRPFVEQFVGPEGKTMLFTMLATVSLVLLIACANVANLLLARAAGRTREVGIRTAVGASRSRVVWQMVLEALAIAAVAALLGTAVAWIGVAAFDRAIATTNPPFFMVFQVDAPILAFIAAVAALSAVVAGGLPALKASGADVSSILKDESRGSSSLRIGRLSRVLVVGEIAMSLALLVAAGLMTKSIARLNNYEYGFETESVFTARLGLFEAEFPDTAARHEFYRDLEARITALPEARFAALSNALPGMSSGGEVIEIEGLTYGEERDYPFTWSAVAGPGYFETVGVELLAGRDFDAQDVAGSPAVAIVNQSFVERHFPGETGLGRRFRPGGVGSEAPWRTIVGVVPDLHMEGMQNRGAQTAGFYLPIQQSDARFMSILVRGPAQPMSVTESVRSAVASVHDGTPLYFVDTLQARIDEETWIFSIFGSLFLVFGGVALFLAAVGLYGVMAFTVARRTPEVGIRLALGASRAQVLGMVLRHGMGQVGLGLLFGAGLAFLVSRGIATILFDVSPNDPAVFVVIALVLATTGLVASLIPARRATKADPAHALRYD